jgi:serine/threonine-protein kinase
VVPAGSTVTIFVSSGPKLVPVPAVKGEPLSQAQATLRAAGFQVAVLTAKNSAAAPNTVVREKPAAGTKAKFGSQVTIYVAPTGSLVPNVVNEPYPLALGKLGNAGFTDVTTRYVSSPQLANGTVVQQNPPAGSRVPKGTLITLTVVKNAAPSPSPSPPAPSQTPTSTATPTPPAAAPHQRLG